AEPARAAPRDRFEGMAGGGKPDLWEGRAGGYPRQPLRRSRRRLAVRAGMPSGRPRTEPRLSGPGGGRPAVPIPRRAGLDQVRVREGPVDSSSGASLSRAEFGARAEIFRIEANAGFRRVIGRRRRRGTHGQPVVSAAGSPHLACLVSSPPVPLATATM